MPTLPHWAQKNCNTTSSRGDRVLYELWKHVAAVCMDFGEYFKAKVFPCGTWGCKERLFLSQAVAKSKKNVTTQTGWYPWACGACCGMQHWSCKEVCTGHTICCATRCMCIVDGWSARTKKLHRCWRCAHGHQQSSEHEHGARLICEASGGKEMYDNIFVHLQSHWELHRTLPETTFPQSSSKLAFEILDLLWIFYRKRKYYC